MIIVFLLMTLLALMLCVTPTYRAATNRRQRVYYCVPMLIFIPVFASILYVELGAYKEVKSTLLRQKLGTPEEVIARMEAHLAQHPDSKRGWYLLGKLYQSTGQAEKAAVAFEKAK